MRTFGAACAKTTMIAAAAAMTKFGQVAAEDWKVHRPAAKSQ